jgi:hypothetical protein
MRMRSAATAPDAAKLAAAMTRSALDNTPRCAPLLIRTLLPHPWAVAGAMGPSPIEAMVAGMVAQVNMLEQLKR